MRNTKTILSLLFATTVLAGCSLAPDFKMPDLQLPGNYKGLPAPVEESTDPAHWKAAQPMENTDRGTWWKIFADPQLDALEEEAAKANPSLQAAAARVVAARANITANAMSFLPDLDIGGNAVRAQPATAGVKAFGGNATGMLKPYTLYSGNATLSYEADLFGRVRDTEKAARMDAAAQDATYRSTLLALQADVAQNYFALRTLDAQRDLLRNTIKVREEGNRIMQRKFDVGDSGEQDLTRTQSELSTVRAQLVQADRTRATMENALAVLLGKLPSEFAFAEAPLEGLPPAIPAGMPSSLLERRPDIASAQAAMASANARVGVARTAFFPRLILTASGGYESTELSDLFKWGSRTWALGQVAGEALTMSVFDSGRNFARLDIAHAAYDEALANYKQQVLVAFRDVEDNLSEQKLLAEQSAEQDAAAKAATRTTEIIDKRYTQGEVDYFEVITAERDSLAAELTAVQTRGARFTTTITLIRALGGSWDAQTASTPMPSEPVATGAPTPSPEPAPAPAAAPEPAPAPAPAPAAEFKPVTPVEPMPEAAPAPTVSPLIEGPMTDDSTRL